MTTADAGFGYVLPLREIVANLPVAHTPGKETILRRAMLNGSSAYP